MQLELCMKEQYAKVQDYAQELKRTDPNTTVDIMCDFNNLEKQRVFKKMYICLGALKEGFKNESFERASVRLMAKNAGNRVCRVDNNQIQELKMRSCNFLHNHVLCQTWLLVLIFC